MSPHIGEIPRSTFQFDFELERKILAEAEKENPNWSNLGLENLPQKTAKPISRAVCHIFYSHALTYNFLLLMKMLISPIPNNESQVF